MIFHFYRDESIQPDITDRHGLPIDLPLIATKLQSRVDALPMVTLTLRARYVDLVTCDPMGWPRIEFEDQDLVDILSVCKIRYESGDNQGEGTIELDIEIGPDDEASVE